MTTRTGGVRASVLALFVLLILAAFALRVFQLDAVPLRGDEAYSVVHWAQTPFTETWWHMWQDEPAPMGAFLAFWGWTGLTGTSAFALRFLSVLGSTLGMGVTAVLGHRLLGDWRLAGLVALMWAVHPFLIWHGQDARVYGMMSALSPLAFYMLIRALHAEQDRTARFRHWLPYVLVQTLALYIYYLEPLWLVVQGVYVLAHRDGRLRRRAIRAWLVIGALSIPVIVQLYALMFVSGYEGTAGEANVSQLFTWFVPTLLFGQNHWTLPAGVGVAALLLVGLLTYARRRDTTTGVLLIAWISLPLALLTLASLASDFFRPRYVTEVIPGLLLGIVAALTALAGGLPERWRVLVPRAVVMLLVIASLIEVRNYFFYDAPKAGNTPALVDYLSARTTQDTVILSGSRDPALEHYFDGPGRLVMLPFDWYESDWQATIDRMLRRNESIYLLTSENTGRTGAYLQEHAQHIPGDTYPNVVQFRSWEVSADEIRTPANVSFGRIARLRGYTLLADSTLVLYWEAVATSEREHSVLLHLGRDGTPPVVLDHALSGAVISTRTWSPGTLYRDPVALPRELPPGDYPLLVGMYPGGQPDTPLTSDAAQDSAGRVSLGTITIHPRE